MAGRQFKAALVAINAKYIHTGLGVRSICAYVQRRTDIEIDFLEYTINHHEQDVLSDLYQEKADVYLFSCYIWNVEMVLRLVRDLRQLFPAAHIGLGGPQAGYQAQGYMASYPEVDFIVTGEGEETISRLLPLLAENKPLTECLGITWRDGDAVVSSPARPPIPMDDLAFAYPDIGGLKHRIFYYESIRGCPFGCTYCTSSIERGVRKRSLELVYADLAIFLAHKVPQVKFVDRTFNCDKKHSRAIWEWLVAHDNGVTNFHFELSGELLDEDTLTFLSGVRLGLFQFEIGVQSTHPQTLAEIDRPANLPLLFARVQRLLSYGNIHVHLDLIAGLPYETFERFQTSFNDVYAYMPSQFQLGVLKVLAGSKMERMANDYGLVYSRNAPYEILSNRWLDYSQLAILQGVAKMVDVYYNSFRFSHILSYLIPCFPTPFSFYHALWSYFQAVTENKPVSQMGYYDILNGFVRQQNMETTEKMQWLAKYDLLLHEKPRKLPAWITVDLSKQYREQIKGFYMNPANIAAYLPEYEGETSVRIERMAHLEVFPFHPENGTAGEVAIVFDYRCRDIVGLAKAHVLPVDAL